MSTIMRRVVTITLFLLAYNPAAVAADANDDQESVIDVMGKVANHDYFELPWTKVYLPRIFLSDGDWFFLQKHKKCS